MALLAPIAAAQLAPAVQMSVDPLPDAAPLLRPVEAPFHVDVSCVLAGVGPQPTGVSVRVTQAPAWATVIVAPTSFVIDATTCNGGTASVKGALNVTALDTAPAWKPGAIALEATVAGMAGDQKGAAGTNLTAKFFSVLDVGVDEAVATVAPGATHAFHLALENKGNDRTRVSVQRVDGPEWLRLEPVPDVILESAQQGGSPTSRDVVLNVTALGGSALTNRVGNVDLRIVSQEERSPPAPGDTSSVSLVVTERGQALHPAPGASPLTALAAVALVALVRRARRG